MASQAEAQQNMWIDKLKLYCGLAAGLVIGYACYGQDVPADKPEQIPEPPSSTAPAPSALPAPAMVGALQFPSRVAFEAGPLGKWNLNGVASGTALLQNNPVPGNNTDQFAINSGQLILQKADGWWQIYVQAGAYNIVSLGTPYVSTQTAIDQLVRSRPGGLFETRAGEEYFAIDWQAADTARATSTPSTSRTRTSNAVCYGTKPPR